MLKLNCLLNDICLPDYYSGHHLAWICVPVTRHTTFKQLRLDLHNELSMSAVGGSDNHQSDHHKLFELWHKAACAAINRDIVPVIKGKKLAFPRIDSDCIDEDGYCDSIMAYFVFRDFEQEPTP